MKMLMQQVTRDFGELRDKGWTGDGLLIAAKVLLYVLLVGLLLAFVMSIGGLVTHVASKGFEVLRPPVFGVASPILQAVLTLGALDLLIGAVLRLMALIDTVEAGNAFSLENAERLESIGGAVIGLMALGFTATLLGAAIQGNINGFPLVIDPSPGGVVVAMLLFILARAFRKGAEMRDDLEGTV